MTSRRVSHRDPQIFAITLDLGLDLREPELAAHGVGPGRDQALVALIARGHCDQRHRTGIARIQAVVR